jgi:hypothetical protein
MDVKLYNDVHFSRAAAPPVDQGWAPFPRLPAELRLHIWLLFLRRRRMIEVGVRPAKDEEGGAYPGDDAEGQSRFYARLNHLGNRVSGRGYTLVLKGGQGFATALNPLLGVSSEARQVALGFYRVHLPFPGRHGEQLLYFNPEYDVLSAWPACVYRTEGFVPMPNAATVLVDLLCDMRAYDPKDQGCVSTSRVLPLAFIYSTPSRLGSTILPCVRTTGTICLRATRPSTERKMGRRTRRKQC